MANENPPPRLRFGYWSDPLCIWAFVAQPKLEQILDEYADRLDVDYHQVPVFGSIPWRFAHGPWAHAGVQGREDTTRRIAAAHGFSEVDGRCWSADQPASSWPAGMALKAVQGLCERELIAPERFAEYQWELRRRFFIHNQNVARRVVQLELAEQLGLPRAELETALDDGSALAKLWEDHQERERLHIQGSPTYVFDGGRAQLFGNFSFGILHATVAELLVGLHPDGSAC